MCNRAMLHDVAAIRGHCAMSWEIFVMFKNLAAIPSIVVYRKIILLGRTRSDDVVQRPSQYKLKTSHDVSQGCAMMVRRRVMVVRWSCINL